MDSEGYVFGGSVTQRNLRVVTDRQKAYSEQLGGWQEQLEMIYEDEAGWRAKIAQIRIDNPKE
ncbi:MAG: hypothetical protein CMK23_10030 [Porticoccaceae bacterium]|jgi:hypothetical protein|nr:hypothetical protein [Porticoccaceae bacterium]|tara:strand:+ start:322 stop:510 length:189 start_codon:yes stop_codon:yes gene_type:complete